MLLIISHNFVPPTKAPGITSQLFTVYHCLYLYKVRYHSFMAFVDIGFSP
jgi:hypothetical protein